MRRLLAWVGLASVSLVLGCGNGDDKTDGGPPDATSLTDANDGATIDAPADSSDAGTLDAAPKLASFVVQTQPPSIDDPFNTSQPGAISALGGRGITLAYYFYQSGRYNTQIDNLKYDGMPAPGQPTDAAVGAWTTAAKAAGLTITLKPHLEILPGNGPKPPWNGATPPILPGGLTLANDKGSRQVSGAQENNVTVTVSCDTNGVVTAVPSQQGYTVFTQADVGRRVLATKGELPHTTLSNYGLVSPGDKGQPAWNTIASVTDATHAVVKLAPANKVSFTMYIINDDPSTGAHAWFVDWQSKLDHVLAVMKTKGGCDWLNLSTEQRQLTIAFDAEFRLMIQHFRTAYPTLGLTVGPNEDDGTGTSNLASFDVVHFWDALGMPDGKGGGLGILSIDAYMGVQGPSDPKPLQLATVEANWQSPTTTNGMLPGGWIGQMSTIRNAWQSRFNNKDFPWRFTELGYQTIKDAGIHNNPSIVADPTFQDQATCIQGFLNTAWQQPWFYGFDYWAWIVPSSNEVDPNPTTTFEPKAPTIADFKAAFGK